MSIGEFNRIISQFPRIKAIVFCGIGEPLLNNSIADMIALAKKRINYVNLITNGTLLTPEKTKEIAKAGLTRLQISFHSSISEAAQKIMGVSKETHNLLHDNIRRAVKIAKKINPKICVALNCVLNRENIGAIHPLIQFASIHGVDEIDFIRMTTMFGRLNDINITNSRVELTEQIEVNLKKFGLRGGILANKGMCPQMWTFVMVHADGEISPCNGIMPHEKIGLGNLLKQDIRDIWHSGKYRELRRMVRLDSLKNCDYCEVGKQPRKIPISNGICALRLKCANVDKKGCIPFPAGNDKFVECGIYQNKPKRQ